MKIKQLILYTWHIEEQTEFYKNVLGFPMLEKTEDHVSFQIGTSILCFYHRETSSPYHLAFNIPSNQEKEALAWLKTRVEVLRNEESQELIDFKDWNAKAMYFYDKDKNIIELIARKNTIAPSSSPFRAQSLLCISEVGVGVNNIERTYHHLNEIKKLPIYSGDFKDFCAAGDEEGLFIMINKDKRKWYPADDTAYSSYFRMTGDYNIEFTNGKINKL